MKDFLKKYENKRNFVGKIYMVLGAFVMAFAFNFLVLDGTNLEKNFKTSVLNSSQTEKKADFYLEKEDGKLFLKNFKKMENVKNISFSLVYDSENLQIDEITSDLSKVDILGEKMSGSETFILNFDKKNISPNQKIAEINFSKKDEKIGTNLNLINSNFTDFDENIFELTTSGINL